MFEETELFPKTPPTEGCEKPISEMMPDELIAKSARLCEILTPGIPGPPFDAPGLDHARWFLLASITSARNRNPDGSQAEINKAGGAFFLEVFGEEKTIFTGQDVATALAEAGIDLDELRQEAASEAQVADG